MQPLCHELPIYRQCRPRKCSGTERHDIRTRIYTLKPLKVAREHSKIRHEMVGKEDGLRTLEMRIARHNHIPMLCSGLCEGLLQRANVCHHVHDGMAYKEMRIESHLIVAAACRVQAAARIADCVRETLFDIHVNIFKCHTEIKIFVLDLGKDVLQPLLDCRMILLREDADLGEHGGMGK